MSNKTTPPKLAYSINEACKASSIGKTMIYALIKAGSLKAVHIGGRTIIPADSLHALIENGSPYSRHGRIVVQRGRRVGKSRPSTLPKD